MVLNKVNDIRNYLIGTFKERNELVEGLLTALVAKQHILLIGAPGTAKSGVTVMLSKLITGTHFFQWLITKYTTPEELYGPYDLSKLKMGQYERITGGKLPVAHIGYIDEMWKGSSAILNSLLTLINERIFYNGTGMEKCPLFTLIGCSNEYPTEEELQAAFDRFMLRYEPGYIKEDGNFAEMLMGKALPQPASLTLDELVMLQQKAEQISIDQTTVDAIVSLRSDLLKEGIVLSDRRWRQCVRNVLPARAVLSGRDHIVIEEDAEILIHALWDDPSQKATVASLVRKRLDPLSGQIVEFLEDAQDIYNTGMKATDDQAVTIGTECIKKLKRIRIELENLIKTGGPATRIEKVKQADLKVKELLEGVTKQCLGI